MNDSRDRPPSRPQSAEELYSNYLRRKRAGEAVDFESYCTAHSSVEEGLRFLHSFAGSLEAGVTTATTPSGCESELQNSVARALHGESPSVSTEELANLIERKPTYSSQSLKRYLVEGVVARGGMSVVLSARDADLGRRVAIKVLLPRMDSGEAHLEAALRFLREARIGAKLDHPGIVQVLDVGSDPEGHRFFTMPLVSGMTLDAVFEKYRRGGAEWSLARVIGLLVQVCHALEHAHSRGVVHRDVKPTNVMVGAFGELYVMDWGLAREVDSGRALVQEVRRGDSPDTPLEGDDTELTAYGAVLGTPPFMAPEQAEGNPELVGPRTDVYAVGAMLYTLLTGQVPYSTAEGDRSETTPARVLQRVRSGPPVAVERLAPKTPPELVSICQRAMERDTANRYSSMGELGADLQDFLDDRVVRAHHQGAVPELRKWVKRNRAAALFLASLFLVVVVSVAVVTFIRTKAREEIVQLTDLKVLLDLERRAESLGSEESLSVLDRFLRDANAALSGLPEYERRLEELRKRGQPVDGKHLRSRAAIDYLPFAKALEETTEEGLGVEAEMRQLRRHRVSHVAFTSESIFTARLETLKNRRRMARQRRNGLRKKLKQFGHYEFTSKKDQFAHDTLATLVLELRAMLFEAPVPGLLRRAEKRFLAGDLSLAVPEWATRWGEVTDSIRANARYSGLTLEPQFGLLPLGVDPDSGLFEFAHPETGDVPTRGEDGRLVVTERTCLVFVLLPPRPRTKGEKESVKRLRAFFASKFEMTQHNWQTLTQRNPSHFGAGITVAGKKITWRHPVEGISTEEATKVLGASGLAVPKRAEWLWLAGCGAFSGFESGDDPKTLRGRANVRDLFSRNAGGFGNEQEFDTWLDDGYLLHAPVGLFDANAFGIHDVHGNVWELCRGSWRKRFQNPGRPLDHSKGAVGDFLKPGRAFGGSFRDLAIKAELNDPAWPSLGSRSGSIGVRPVRPIREPLTKD